ncbi:MAG TPA: NfeD family protein [Solirubrobacterales bacterium]|nr:NfeD family protein [Solirubrobacterales bacterium]
MPDWAVWFIVGAALMAGELLVTAAVLGPIGLAAFGAGIVAAFDASSEVQIASFIVFTLLSLVFARPIAKRHLVAQPPEFRTNAPALLGEEALVMQQVDRDSGQVKVGGDVWSARPVNPQDVFEPGDRVIVESVHRTVLNVSKGE